MIAKDLLELYKLHYLGRTVIEVQNLLYKDMIIIRLTFDNGMHLNFSYSSKFVDMGGEIERATIDKDLGEILDGSIDAK